MSNTLVPSASKQQLRIAVEQQYGTLPGSPAYRRLTDISGRPSPQMETDPFIPSGDLVPSLVVLNDDYTTFDVTGRASYTSLMYILSSLFGLPTSTLLSGSTYQHVWTWNGTDEIFPVTYAMDYGDGRIARRMLGGIFNGLGITTSRSGMDFSSSVVAKELNPVSTLGGLVPEVQTATISGTPTGGTFTLTFDGRTVTAIPYNTTAAALQTLIDAVFGEGHITAGGGPAPGTPLTLTFGGRYSGINVGLATSTAAFTGGTTPAVSIAQTTPGSDGATLVPAVPIFPLHSDVFVDNTWAAVQAETTQLTAIYSLEMGLGERFARTAPINSLKASDAMVENEGQEHTISMQLGADSTSDALLSAIRSGTMKYVRARYVGAATGDSTHKYTAKFDMAMLLTGTDGYDSANGVHVMTWQGRLAKDSSGNCFQATIINKQAGL
jgi:hypothetical protein